jgi:transcriptional regulator with XRE-family HTH domain
MSTVIRLENHNRLPNPAALVRIATAVGIEPAELLPAAEPVTA